MKYSFFQKLFAELLGTFILATVVLATLTPSIPFPIPTPLAASMALLVCVYLFGDVSGCHINPAISLSMLITGNIDYKHFIGYIIAQVLGGIIALLVISAYIPVDKETWLIVQHPSWYAALGELVGAAYFGFCVMTTVYNKAISPVIMGIFIGISLLVGITMSHPASYGILNPAVALATKSWSWDYFVMPFIGAAIGSAISTMLFKKASLSS